MEISYKWLKQYIDIDLNPQELGQILTDLGLEVDSIEKHESIKGGLEGLVIGKVVECEKHPNADKLSKTKVDLGTGELIPIVCGAPNVAAGQKVVVATVGTTLYSGEESFKIKKSKIRGEVSEGMICAEDEIGVGTSHAGIIVLPEDTPVGMLAKDYYNVSDDYVFEIGLTPNRPDATSHYGVARDLFAYYSLHNPKELKKPSVENFKIDNTSLQIPVIVENAQACPRYTGLTISGIEVKESPEWLKERLKAIGQKPINNVVDVTNFVLHELGQPLHAFDAAKISGGKVIVKCLPSGSKFKTLDGNERELNENDLMICNSEGGMCIGGVFGGIESGVSNTTTSIFLESAYFNPVYIRKTSKRHQLNTDASFRFERGTDPNMPVFALKRAALLIKEVAGGQISSEIIDVYPEAIKDFQVEVSYKNVNRLIGKVIPAETIKKIVLSLEMKITEENENGLKLEIPPYRVDVQREADVIEDILRLYGYNNVEYSEVVNSTLAYVSKPDNNQLRDAISNFLSANGFNEAMSNSLTKHTYYEKCETYKEENTVKILNPISSDLSSLRQTLFFGCMEAVAYNANRRNLNLKLYEFGNCYFKTINKESEVTGKSYLNGYSEGMHLAFVLSGAEKETNWNAKDENADFYHLKAYVDLTLKRLGFEIEKLAVAEIHNDIFAYGLTYSIKNKLAVKFGAVSGAQLKAFDVKADVFYADFDWNVLIENLPAAKKYKALPVYPSAKRDLSMLLDKNITFAQLKEAAQKTERKLLKSVEIFDVYEGKNLGEGKKSYALSFTLQDEEKTLTDQQIDRIMNNLIKAFETGFGAKIR